MADRAAAAAAATTADTIYVLKLENEKYYVGKTSRSVQERFLEHARGHGSAWTRFHPPVSILIQRPCRDAFDEDAEVKRQMQQFGMDNVRGGCYSQVELDDAAVETLERELLHADNRCLQCGSASHYMAQCPQRNVESENDEDESDDDEDEHDDAHCLGTNQNGQPCQRSLYLNTQGYCTDHAHQGHQ